MLILTGYLDGCIIFHREVYQSRSVPIRATSRCMENY